MADLLISPVDSAALLAPSSSPSLKSAALPIPPTSAISGTGLPVENDAPGSDVARELISDGSGIIYSTQTREESVGASHVSPRLKSVQDAPTGRTPPRKRAFNLSSLIAIFRDSDPKPDAASSSVQAVEDTTNENPTKHDVVIQGDDRSTSINRVEDVKAREASLVDIAQQNDNQMARRSLLRTRSSTLVLDPSSLVVSDVFDVRQGAPAPRVLKVNNKPEDIVANEREGYVPNGKDSLDRVRGFFKDALDCLGLGDELEVVYSQETNSLFFAEKTTHDGRRINDTGDHNSVEEALAFVQLVVPEDTMGSLNETRSEDEGTSQACATKSNLLPLTSGQFHQFASDPCRTAVITLLVSPEDAFVQFARTTRTAGWTKGNKNKTGGGLRTAKSRKYHLCSPTCGNHSTRRQDLLLAFHGAIFQARSICTSSSLSRRGYAFKGMLGSGSTAVVCEVVDKVTGSSFAAKSVDPQHRERFEAERRALNRLSFVGLMGDDDGQSTGVVEGVAKLREVLDDTLTIITAPVGVALNRLPWGSIRSARPFAAIARALGALSRSSVAGDYSRGYLHRDVSPGNIIVVSSSAHTPRAVVSHEPHHHELVLIDFGMAVENTGRPEMYSGSRFFASDQVCRALIMGNNINSADWHSREIVFTPLDDLESLLKTALWTLDFESHGIVSRAAKDHNHNLVPARHPADRLTPSDVLGIWSRVWKTEAGKRFKRALATARAAGPERAHQVIAEWLEKTAWTQCWSWG